MRARNTNKQKRKTKQSENENKRKQDPNRNDATRNLELKETEAEKSETPPGTDSPPPAHERPGEIAIREWHARDDSVWGDGGHFGRVRGGTRPTP
nr:MAG TPA: hypothetical protein [Caudoviricetes sp.]